MIYKLEDRVLFDAAMPLDATGAMEQAEGDNPVEGNSEESVAEYQSFEESASAEESDNYNLLDTITADTDSDAEREIYIIDSNVDGYEELINALPANSECYVLEQGEGMGEVAAALSEHSDIAAIHIFSHGSDGKIIIGESELSSDNLSLFSDDLKVLGGSLATDGDILFYGCNVAESDIGKSLILDIAEITQADVAASENFTGEGGDWVLEYQIGGIDTETIVLGDFNGFLDNTNNTGDGVITVADVQREYTDGGTGNFEDYIDDALRTEMATVAADTTITFDGDLMTLDGDNNDSTLTITVDQTIRCGKNVSISGDIDDGQTGDIDVIFDGGAQFGDATAGSDGINRMFGFSSAATLSLKNLTIQNINSNQEGAAIFADNEHNIVLDTVVISDVHTSGSGVVYKKNSGSLTVSNSLFEGNRANQGAAIYAKNLDNVSSQVVEVRNSTFYGNHASSHSTIYVTKGDASSLTFTMANSTVTENTTSNTRTPGGIYISSGINLNLTNSIVARNDSGSEGGNGKDDIQSFGSIQNNTDNIVQATNKAELKYTGDLSNLFANVVDGAAVLEANGGATKTVAVNETGPAGQTIGAQPTVVTSTGGETGDETGRETDGKTVGDSNFDSGDDYVLQAEIPNETSAESSDESSVGDEPVVTLDEPSYETMLMNSASRSGIQQTSIDAFSNVFRRSDEMAVSTRNYSSEALSPDNAPTVFDEVDFNEDGLVSLSEFQTFFNTLTDDEVNVIDVDEDGEISLDELEKLLKRLQDQDSEAIPTVDPFANYIIEDTSRVATAFTSSFQRTIDKFMTYKQ